MVFLFDRAALICTSPLRYLRHQQGTLYGLPSGASVSLGYRATVCDHEDVTALLPITFGLPAGEEYWSTWMESALPAIGTTLAEAGVVGEGGADGEPAWGIGLRFAQGRRYRLSYRPELDGSLELAAPGQHFSLGQIVVEGPEQDFGWLHPAVPLDFILDDQVWRTAKVADWPLALRKALQSHHAPEAFYGSVALPIDKHVSEANECQLLRRDGFVLPMHKTGRQKISRYRLAAAADLCGSCA